MYLKTIILGDFNAILSPKDKKSDRSTGKRCNLFGNFVDTCNLPILLKTRPTLNIPRGRPFYDAKEEINRILSLRLSNGEWSSEQDILSDEAVKYFEKLYGETPTPTFNAPLINSPHDIDFLNKVVSNEEIRNALFDMAPLKAPGSDGFHAYFFQSQWDTVGGAVCQWVQGILMATTLKRILTILIVLIPKKKESPEDFSQFRPISLCSVLYKVIQSGISKQHFPQQAGFILGGISDNIIIAQEIIHSMRSRRGNKKWMAIKLDLEKAYDRVSWRFIEVSLEAAGVPEKIRKVIMTAISSSIMQILWNGVPSRSFKPVRGIRQGCPLSPYLFVL
ncbi:LINE-type retrotransposon LIb DNA [Gossypium australe]|uniref:LINE-type retrotransposon LIb DNA n=1 Tax=Gossypium australe TaxID=47621 RepID=A0A5B6X1J3_9ROSI|nr:LINE-type retrotransposon LIb DNA [Gossypium australe]